MKNKKLYMSIVLVVVIAVASVSCDLFSQKDRTFNGPPQVELFPLNASVNADGVIPIKVQRIAQNRDNDVTVSLSVVDSSTTAPDNAYSLSTNSVTIPADSNSAQFTVNITASNVSQIAQLVILLTGSDEVKAAPNLRRSTILISPPPQ